MHRSFKVSLSIEIPLSHYLSISRSHSLSLTHTLSLSRSLALSLSLSIALSHTHCISLSLTHFLSLALSRFLLLSIFLAFYRSISSSLYERERGGCFIAERERDDFLENPLIPINLIIVMIRWTDLAPWQLEIHFPGSLISTFLVYRGSTAERHCTQRTTTGLLP